MSITLNGTTGITTPGGNTTDDVTFGDNDKAIFGAGSDLQIYHDGSHSYLSDQGTGNIKVLADDFVLKNSADTANMIVALTGGAATLYHDGDTRLATTATGIDVTGSVTAVGGILETTNGTDISMDTTASGQLKLDGNGYGGAIALNAQGMSIYHNSSTRNIMFGTNETERMRIDSTGAVTMPYQPAFLARPVSNQNNIAVGSHIDVVFGTEVFDQNSDFTSNTFTAPVAGRYQLNFSLRLQEMDSAASYIMCKIVTSNRDYESIFDPDFGQDAQYWNPSLGVLADMDANDTARVTFFQGVGAAQTDIHTQSHFSGYLVA